MRFGRFLVSLNFHRPSITRSGFSKNGSQVLFSASEQENVASNMWTRQFQTTHSCFVGQEWRRKRGKPSNHNAYGPLTDGPDYTFLDGRPTPLGAGKVRRAQEQRIIAAEIIKLASEVDFAVERHQRLQKEEEERKNNILGKKLKLKGKVVSSRLIE